MNILMLNIDNSITYPYSLYQLKKDHTNVSFPAKPLVETLQVFGVYPVIEEPQPEFDPKTHNAVLQSPIKENGQWVRKWTVYEKLGAEEIVEWLAPFIQQIKNESNHRIYERIPQTKQSNYAARIQELKMIADGIQNPSHNSEDPESSPWIPGWEPRSWTPQEEGEFNFILAEWLWVKAVRNASNQIEALLDTMTGTEILAYNIRESELWPA